MKNLKPYDIDTNPARNKANVEKRIQLFRRKIEALGGVVNDHYVFPNASVLFRVHVTDEDAITIKEWPMVWSVEKPPRLDTFDWHTTS